MESGRGKEREKGEGDRGTGMRIVERDFVEGERGREEEMEEVKMVKGRGEKLVVENSTEI